MVEDNKEETITISKKQYDHLIERVSWLDCLEAAGVDNWCGFEHAQTMRDEVDD